MRRTVLKLPSGRALPPHQLDVGIQGRVMGIHQWGSLSSWPFFDDSSLENSLSNAESNEAVRRRNRATCRPA